MPTLDESVLEALAGPLRSANAAFARRYPGERPHRQPVHTVYGGAHLFKSTTARRLGEIARRMLSEFAEDEVTFARVLALPGADRLPNLPDRFSGVKARLKVEARATESPAAFAGSIYRRVIDKLEREPVEDFRIDFEDGYGIRSDSEEDGHAESAAREVGKGLREGTLPPFIGIRTKPLSEEARRRALRTVDGFLTTLVRDTDGRLPPNFVVTLPKVSLPEQVAYVGAALDRLESALGLQRGAIGLELMIETPQSVISALGQSNVPHLVEAGGGRVKAAHFGTYDYTAACNITAEYQQMTHPACDFARHVMQVTLAGTGVWLSDGATNVMPVAPNRADEGQALSEEQIEENRHAVHRAWRLHYEHVRHSLLHAYYQGWDLHPAQLPTRYAAVYAFFLEGLDSAADRLRNFIEKAARATIAGEIFDDAATGQGLLNYFLRAVNCGAVSEDDAMERSGLSLDELRSRSFARILAARQARS
jgi:citrate lyase beta subunit